MQRRGRCCPCRGGIRNQDKPLQLGGLQDLLPVRWGQKTLLPEAPAPLLSIALGTVSSGFLLQAPKERGPPCQSRSLDMPPYSPIPRPLDYVQTVGMRAKGRTGEGGQKGKRWGGDEGHSASGRRAPVTRFKPLPSGMRPPAAVRESTGAPSTSSPLPGPRTEAVNRLLPGQWENETRCQR